MDEQTAVSSLKERSANLLFQRAESSFQASATGENPFCGDQLEVRVTLAPGPHGPTVESASFDGYACSLCMVTADLLIERSIGLDAKEAVEVKAEDLLKPFGNVKIGRTRMNCANLPLDLFRKAVSDAAETVA